MLSAGPHSGAVSFSAGTATCPKHKLSDIGTPRGSVWLSQR